MNIDMGYLERCVLHPGPAIALSYGEQQERVLTLSPNTVPLDHGICLLQVPSGAYQLFGFALRKPAVGIPQNVAEYVVGRLQREVDSTYRLVAYGLGLSIHRVSQGWQVSLGNHSLAVFNKAHVDNQTVVKDLVLTGNVNPGINKGYMDALIRLIGSYI